MLIDALGLDNGFALECDLCIVGTGAAGLTLATSLNHTSVSVCLLESGGFEMEEETQRLYEGDASGNVPSLPEAYLQTSRLRFFGGSTNHWGGHCRPLEAIDFEKRSWVPHSGWPFDKRYLLDFYRRAAAYMDIGGFEADNPDAGDPRYPVSLDSQWVEGKVFRWRPKRFGFDHKKEMLHSRNIRLVTHANAIEIAPNRSQTSIEEVRVATLTGLRGAVKARAYVIATGGIENCRLLLASTSRSPDGVGNQNDLVGRYFMEHPVSQSAIGPLALWPEVPTALYRDHSDSPGNVRYRNQVIYPREKVLRDQRMLTTMLRLVPFSHYRYVEAANEITGAHLPQPDELDDFDHALLGAAFETDHLSEASTVKTPPQLFHSSFVCEQEPNPESRVTLSHERDALGMPRAKLAWNLTGAVTETLIKMADLIAKSVSIARLGRLRVATEPEDLQKVFWHGSHHMGTTRMHRDPKRGVVDPDGRIHGIDNIYIAGSSVFPTCGAANPTFTIVALTIRLSDHLKKRFGVT